MFSIAMKYVKDEEAAADVTQEALLLAHRHRDSFRGDAQFSTWLYRVAATTSLMWLRRQRRIGREVPSSRAPDDDGESLLDSRPDPHASPEGVTAGGELIQRVAAGVAALGTKYVSIFWMRYLEGYTETEIADRLGLSLATVKTRAHRAKQAARASLVDGAGASLARAA
ncbi:MAG: sigma-70 family RNA polymerase sigma factor [Kofleriaceae bacterium]|nr:sigma-70 family RNA polymerase sigma factor [Kofleriaceae bacterium]MCB9573015.1 sigma-70 family RNA polymerase sigma factor [Kofleriaceae bacterium]